MRIFLLFVLSVQCLFAYTDPELEALWSHISNIKDPTLEDYRLIESYLQSGDRPYLKSLYDTSVEYGWPQDYLNVRMQQKRNFKLVGPNGEMPVFELHKLRIIEKTKDRCILVYSSYNQLYPQKTYKLLEELKECGYSGNVMIRIGGFPNISESGLKFSPFFVWKNEFIKEALRMGFTKILHLDTSVHPLSDLNSVFDTMDTKGYYLLWERNHCPYLSHHQHLRYLRISQEDKDQIPWLPGYIIGLNFADRRVVKLFYDWDFATKDFERFNFLGNDEVIMTILAWQHRLVPTGYFYNHVIESDCRPRENLISDSIEFYFDRLRN